MKILAIETATPSAGCALWGDAGPVASFILAGPQRHAEVLMPAIDALCRWAGWSVADLTGVAVDTGPGLFTGLRVGLATARAIATARGIPAAGVSSLEALAYRHRRRSGLVAPVVDARRGEVYRSLYKTDGKAAEELWAPAVVGPEELAAELSGLAKPVLAVGDGARRYKGELEAAGVEVGDEDEMWPSPLAVAQLGAQRLADGNRGERGLPGPLYLRQADVRIGWEEVGGRVGGRSGQFPAPVRGPGGKSGSPASGPEGAAASSPAAPKLAP